MVALAVGVLMCGFGVSAAINLYKNRMDALDSQEKKEYVEDVRDSNADADSFSRNLTDEERERLEVLQWEYENNGWFPESALLQIESEDDIDLNRVCFEPTRSIFYLPERTLTDEDLLEIIDFWHARDYSLQENSPQLTQEELKNEIASDVRVTGEQEADEALKKVLGVEPGNFEMTVEYAKIDDGIDKIYVAYYHYAKKGEIIYNVEIELDGADVCMVSYADEYDADEVRFNNDNKCIPDEVNNLAQSLYGRESWDDQFVTYRQGSGDTMVKNGVISYCFVAGDRLIEVDYSLISTSCCGYIVYDSELYKDLTKEWVKVLM